MSLPYLSLAPVVALILQIMWVFFFFFFFCILVSLVVFN